MVRSTHVCKWLKQISLRCLTAAHASHDLFLTERKTWLLLPQRHSNAPLAGAPLLLTTPVYGNCQPRERERDYAGCYARVILRSGGWLAGAEAAAPPPHQSDGEGANTPMSLLTVCVCDSSQVPQGHAQ
jgi:hypothetical protein